MNTARRLYLNSVGWILLVTALAKIYSASGTAALLDLPEALLPMTNRQTLWLIGGLELAIMALTIGRLNATIKLIAILWLGSNFLLYHAAVRILAVGAPCPCLGSITEMLPVSRATVDRLLAWIVFYLVVGSSFFLLAGWLEGKVTGGEEESSGELKPTVEGGGR